MGIINLLHKLTLSRPGVSCLLGPGGGGGERADCVSLYNFASIKAMAVKLRG